MNDPCLYLYNKGDEGVSLFDSSFVKIFFRLRQMIIKIVQLNQNRYLNQKIEFVFMCSIQFILLNWFDFQVDMYARNYFILDYLLLQELLSITKFIFFNLISVTQ